jgi:hypothetical protein
MLLKHISKLTGCDGLAASDLLLGGRLKRLRNRADHPDKRRGRAKRLRLPALQPSVVEVICSWGTLPKHVEQAGGIRRRTSVRRKVPKRLVGPELPEIVIDEAGSFIIFYDAAGLWVDLPTAERGHRTLKLLTSEKIDSRRLFNRDFGEGVESTDALLPDITPSEE